MLQIYKGQISDCLVWGSGGRDGLYRGSREMFVLIEKF